MQIKKMDKFNGATRSEGGIKCEKCGHMMERPGREPTAGEIERLDLTISPYTPWTDLDFKLEDYYVTNVELSPRLGNELYSLQHKKTGKKLVLNIL